MTTLHAIRPVDPAPAPSGTPVARLLDGRDCLLMLGFMAAGLALRLAWFSGFGLGDDFIFRNEVNTILVGKTVLADNQAYRFTWWFPAALSCRVFGLNEVGLVAPFTAAATVGTGLVYALGKALYGRPGAVVAALLLLFHPLDFVWSTMLTNDIMMSVTAALTILFALRALAQDDRTWRRRLWTLAGITLWLGFHAKLSAAFLIPALALICLVHRERLTADVLCLVFTAAGLLVLSGLVAYAFTGDPLFSYHSELSFQGLSGPGASTHVISPHMFWYYPRLLFFGDELGDFLYGFQPSALVGLLVLAPFLRLRTSSTAVFWFVCAFLIMQLNIQRADGVWISGFRNIRHTHPFVYPLILLLTGFVVALWKRLPRLAYVLLALLVGVGAWQSVSAAAKTRIAFGDRRKACEYLAALPRDIVHLDEGLGVYCAFLTLPGGPLRVQQLHPNPDPRRTELASVTSGYVVTGGSREPYYGCPHCIPRASELVPGRWTLLQELPGPAVFGFWRPEPVRIWQAARPDAPAGTPGP